MQIHVSIDPQQVGNDETKAGTDGFQIRLALCCTMACIRRDMEGDRSGSIGESCGVAWLSACSFTHSALPAPRLRK
jgi:hypothetical protein